MIKSNSLSMHFRLFLLLTIFSSVLSFQSRPHFTYVKNGDPDIHLEHHTYARLTFLRGHVIDERHLNKKGDCNATCSDYNQTKFYQHRDNSSLKQTIMCNGNIYRCKEVHHFSTFQTMRIDNQLYEFIYNKDINDYEFKKTDDHLAHYYWTRGHKFVIRDNLHDSSHCQMCKCYCDDIHNKHSVRSFCQDLMLANTAQGYVITGVKLSLRNHMIYTDIQQGKLTNGVIDQQTVHWKTGDKCQFYGYFNYEDRSIQLDDVFVPSGQIITGVSWTRYDHGTNKMGYSAGRLSLTVHATVVDNHGNLVAQNWTLYYRTHVRRRSPFKVGKADVSTSVTIKGNEISEPNKYYIKFRATDWIKDFAQNVVPFIDLQKVVTNPPRPLSGIGVYYRAAEGLGGFLAFKIMYDKAFDAIH